MFLNHALAGDESAAIRSLAPDVQRALRWDEGGSWQVAAGYSLLGRREEALDWLENAADHGFLNYPFLNEHDPFLENIRGEERFKALMDRVREAWEGIET
jgi:hypothetical protein